mmetsp:Transcript_15004/g.35396  ORF Transcript_15004/g.35396 Transcript_15004/m.35396 type:complete len:587 (-) Transcript_15004:252-2012(-)
MSRTSLLSGGLARFRASCRPSTGAGHRFYAAHAGTQKRVAVRTLGVAAVAAVGLGCGLITTALCAPAKAAPKKEPPNTPAMIKAAAAYRERAQTRFEQELSGEETDDSFVAGEIEKGLPTFTRAEVSKHCSPEVQQWVTFRGGVYNITEFVDNHPGGAKILLAIGKDVGPFWFLFQQHKCARTFRFLETMRIGNVASADLIEDTNEDENDPFRHDPKGLEEGRHPAMIVNTEKPFNAEPPPELLIENFVTPTQLHYIRCHLPVPLVDPETYRLSISTPLTRQIGQDLVLTLDDLKTQFPKAEVVSTLQCAGNRVRGAHFQDKQKLIVGTFFDTAMGNSLWGGARLRDVLMHAGLDADGSGMNFVQVEALDKDESDVPFAGSVTIEKAMATYGDVLLAYEMNGKPLPRDHGYPVRLICPGWLGVRNVKWVSKVIASEVETPIYWYQNDKAAIRVAIQEGPVQSLIIEPRFNAKLDPDDDELTVKGYAWSGGGRAIIDVDISIDGGQTWRRANLQQSGQKKWQMWAWTLWECTIPLPKDFSGPLEIVSRAADAAFNTQPQKYKADWVVHGVINNRWHKVPVTRPPRED